MRVALVHDWLTGMRGGEKCLQYFLQLYPQADIFTLVYVPGATAAQIESRIKQTSFIQNTAFGRRHYRLFLPLFPAAIRSFDFKGYDLVVSLSHAAAKNVAVPRGTPHICYCFTPMRYIWDQVPHYFGALTPLAWPLIKYLRAWDGDASAQPDLLVGISRFIQARIRRVYGRKSEVVYPPVNTDWITPRSGSDQGEAFLYAGALVPYKRVDLVIEAFNKLGEKLVIAGSGPDYKSLKKTARTNIQFLGSVDDRTLAQLYKNSRALIFPGEEDFGMVPVESMAAGRPVIACFHGATKETVVGVRAWEPGAAVNGSKHTGVFVLPGKGAQAVSQLVAGVRFFTMNEDRFNSAPCIDQASRFSPQKFFEEWNKTVISCGYALAARPTKEGLNLGTNVAL